LTFFEEMRDYGYCFMLILLSEDAADLGMYFHADFFSLKCYEFAWQLIRNFEIHCSIKTLRGWIFCSFVVGLFSARSSLFLRIGCGKEQKRFLESERHQQWPKVKIVLPDCRNGRSAGGYQAVTDNASRPSPRRRWRLGTVIVDGWRVSSDQVLASNHANANQDAN